MKREEYEGDLLNRLRRHLADCPEARERDAAKFIFQGLLGPGHILSGPDAAEERLRLEMQGLRPDPGERLTLRIGPGYLRLNLRRALAEGLTPRLIARLMCAGDAPYAFTRADAARLCRAAAEDSGMTGLAAEAELLEAEDWIPSHSEAYRRAYRPAYRVIPSRWAARLPALCRVARASAGQARVLATLDGPCCAGKTTLAAELAGVLEAAVLHTDDFVVPHAAKTAERLAIPGGNCDWERLVREVLAPWKAGEDPRVRRYDCVRDRLHEPEALPACRVLLLEGSYCNLPAVRALADARLFLATPEAVRMERLRERESEESLRQFYGRWIPLEEAYFAAYGLPDEGCVLIGGPEGRQDPCGEDGYTDIV